MDKLNSLQNISIHGFRGFETEQILTFAQPNGDLGSGYTVLVGPNNAGKSTIAESVMSATQNQTPTFSEGKRNKKSSNRVIIKITDNANNTSVLSTISSGGSETEFSGDTISLSNDNVFVLPSRRSFDPYFSKSDTDRAQHIKSNQKLPSTRQGQSNFSGRIFHINNTPEKRKEFEKVLKKVLNPLPNWTIDQTDQGTYYLRYSNHGNEHSSDGLGEGVLSIFFIVDALYDSEPGSMIFIDEPELSLHPQLQQKVKNLFLDYSKDRQIVISTHSPKFIDWNSIASGSEIARIVSETNGTKIYQLTADTRACISVLLGNMNNPHVLGLDACEVFFLSDGIVLVEGQEDVMYLPKVTSDLGVSLGGDFYGWGAGGGHQIGIICSILSDLGFKKVVGLLDNNLISEIKKLQDEYSEYFFITQPADDIRHKKDKEGVESLLDESGKKVREKFRDKTTEVLQSINRYLLSD